MEFTTQWQKDLRRYEKGHPGELAAILRNLKRYIDLLRGADDAGAVQGGFLHREARGIVAVDGKGGRAELEQTRLYTYADEAKKVLYLITMGNRNEQPSDLELSKNFVEGLLSSTTSSGAPDQTIQ